MKKQNIQIITLEADEGMILTDGETYSKKVYLGIYNNPDNWHEIPEEDVPETEKNEVV